MTVVGPYSGWTPHSKYVMDLVAVHRIHIHWLYIPKTLALVYISRLDVQARLLQALRTRLLRPPPLCARLWLAWRPGEALAGVHITH